MSATRPRASLRYRWSARPDLLPSYPDPRQYLERPTLFGLTLEQYRAEWLRRRADGWQTWELERRLPAPVGATS